MLYDSPVTFKHMFILASADEATFDEFRGLVSDKTADNAARWQFGTNKFFDVSSDLSFDYYKSEVLYVPSNQLAPVSDKAAVIELQIPDGRDDGRHSDRQAKGFCDPVMEGILVRGPDLF
jgi:hypothetical protein